MINKLAATLALAWMALSTTTAFAQRPTEVQAEQRAEASYLLGAADEIEMTVVGQEDLTLKTRIDADGTIVVPLIGKIKAAEQTTAQLGLAIARAYEKAHYLVKPSVNIGITSYASKTVTVLGHVDKAGLYPLDRPYSAAAIIAKAGGARIDGADVVLLTPANGGAPVRLPLMTSPGAPTYMVQPGDTLSIPAAEMIYVYGQVNDPSGYKYENGMTFRQAMAKAGGPTIAGSTKRYAVKRDGKTIKPGLDELIQPGDVLIIKERLF